MTSNATTDNAPETKGGKLLQIVLSLLIFAGFVVFLFVPNTPFYETSLFTQILNLFKNEFIGSDLTKISLYVMVGMYAVLLVCTVVSFFLGKNGAAALNFIKSIVAVAAIVTFAYALRSEFKSGFSTIFYDSETFVALNSVCLSLILSGAALVLLSLATYKGKGVVKTVSALLAGGFFVFSYFKFIGDYTFANLFNGISLGEDTLANVTELVFRIVFWATLINLALALLGLALPRTSGFDLFRACIILIGAIAAVVLFILYDSFGNLFKTVGILGFTGMAVVQFVFALIVVCVLHSRKKKQAAEEEAAQEEDAFLFDENDQMTFAGLDEQAPEQQPETPKQPEPQPAAEVNPDAENANKAFEDAAQISFDDIAKEQEAAEESAYDSTIRDEAPAAQETPEEEKPFDFNQAKYDGKFNRQYADFAQEQENNAQQQQPYGYNNAQQPYGYGAQQQPPYGYNPQQPYPSAPPYYGSAYQQQPFAQQNAANYYNNAGFIPDAFISSLTPAEKDEFDRLFISRIYGDNKRLPAYRIGGDNREFFTKIFVFIGRYRNVISDGLLEKIYNYSNSIR